MRSKLAVAASGGADSTALILLAAQDRAPEDVTILTVDHHSRSAATKERAYVAALAARFGFSVVELSAYASTKNQGAWRKARMAALLNHCRAYEIPCLWLGHHRDDSIETAAMRLLAGGNLSACAGMSAARKACGICIERPLLHLSARALRRRLMAEGLGWFEDPSNRNTWYRRVAVRRLLAAAPFMEQEKLVLSTGRFRQRMELLVNAIWRLVAKFNDDAAVRLDSATLRRLPMELTAILLHRAAVAVAGREQRVRQVDFLGIVESSVSQDTDYERSHWQLGGVQAWLSQTEWLVARDFRHIQHVTSLTVGQTIEWDARYRLVATAPLPPGRWRVSRVGNREARRLRSDKKAECLAASLGIWCGPEFMAVPDLGVWRGEAGAALRETLSWYRLPPPCNDAFQLAPPTEAPIFSPLQRISGYGSTVELSRNGKDPYA